MNIYPQIKHLIYFKLKRILQNAHKVINRQRKDRESRKTYKIITKKNNNLQSYVCFDIALCAQIVLMDNVPTLENWIYSMENKNDRL